MFINFSNHSSALWNDDQRQASLQYGEIIDIPFPNVNPHAKAEEIQNQAKECATDILKKHPAFVLCQGEFTLAYHVIRILKEHRIMVGAACSDRVVTEKTVDGKTEKTAVFSFVQYREY